MLYTFDVESILVYGSYHNDVTLKLRCRFLFDQQLISLSINHAANCCVYFKLVRDLNLADETNAYQLKCSHRLLPVVFASQTLSSSGARHLQSFSFACSKMLNG